MQKSKYAKYSVAQWQVLRRRPECTVIRQDQIEDRGVGVGKNTNVSVDQTEVSVQCDADGNTEYGGNSAKQDQRGLDLSDVQSCQSKSWVKRNGSKYGAVDSAAKLWNLIELARLPKRSAKWNQTVTT